MPLCWCKPFCCPLILYSRAFYCICACISFSGASGLHFFCILLLSLAHCYCCCCMLMLLLLSHALCSFVKEKVNAQIWVRCYGAFFYCCCCSISAVHLIFIAEPLKAFVLLFPLAALLACTFLLFTAVPGFLLLLLLHYAALPRTLLLCQTKVTAQNLTWKRCCHLKNF